MKEKTDDPIILRTNLYLNNANEKNSFANNSNITGIFLPKFNRTANDKNLNRSNSLNISKNNFGKTDVNFYKKLKEEEKIKYINNLISNSLEKDSFDYMALKRKKFTTSDLINQFNNSNKPKKLEENKICKIPYPLLCCISNRKCENNSSNLLKKILTKENKSLSKNQELVIKYSEYSKIFNTDISKLVEDYKQKPSKTPKLGKYNLPILNKYLKQKFSNFYFRDSYSNKYMKSTSSTPKWTKINIRKNMRRWNSTHNEKNIKKNKKVKENEFKNECETFKNKSVNLFNHNNNMKNVKIIQDRLNSIMEEKFIRNKKVKIDPSVNKIIKDISHLRFNNQIMPVSDKINDL